MGLFLITLGITLLLTWFWFFKTLTPRERWASAAMVLAIGSSTFVLHAVIWYWGWYSLVLIPLSLAQWYLCRKAFAPPERKLRYWGRA
jgi:hypothetical protein